MFGLMIPPSWYIYGALSIAAVGGIWYGHHESKAFNEYKIEVASAAKAQEAKNENIKKQSELVNKGITNEYEAKLSAVRSFYSGMQHSSSGKLPTISNPAISLDESPAYYRLAESCAETTVQLTSLQEWINAQVGLNAK